MTRVIEALEHTSPEVPAMRLERREREDGSTSIELALESEEWPTMSEAEDFATWLAPLVRLWADFSHLSRALGGERAPLADVASSLTELATEMIGRGLTKTYGRWSFTRGRSPVDFRALGALVKR